MTIDWSNPTRPDLLPPTHRFKPELNALLDSLLFCSTVLVNQPTPGMRMQHLRFVDGTTTGGGSDAAASAVRGSPPRLAQRLLLGFLYIGGAFCLSLVFDLYVFVCLEMWCADFGVLVCTSPCA